MSLCRCGENRFRFIDHCSLIFEQGAAAYGNTLIFTAPDTTGNWWGDAAVQSNYGANEIIYCGYRFDPETQLYYVRNRTYNPVLGRWIQRDPIGYAGGINLYGYVDSSPVGSFDPVGMAAIPTTVTGLMASLISNRGYFDGTLSSQGSGYRARRHSYLSLSFVPSKDVTKCKYCNKIMFVQFYQEGWTGGLGSIFSHGTNGWVNDVKGSGEPFPYYPYQTPWVLGGSPANMTDDPGDDAILPGFLTSLQQTFVTFAVCVGGKEAGHAYGEENWGHIFQFVSTFNFWRSSTVTRNLQGASPPSWTGPTSASVNMSIVAK